MAAVLDWGPGRAWLKSDGFLSCSCLTFPYQAGIEISQPAIVFVPSGLLPDVPALIVSVSARGSKNLPGCKLCWTIVASCGHQSGTHGGQDIVS